MVPELIDKYVWLLQTLVNAGERGLTLQQIARRWEDRYGTPYARRTFNNHREAVAEIFGIEIGCHRSDFTYYIDAGSEALESDKTRAWLIDTFTVNSLLSLGKERLSGRVSVDEVPSGKKHLTDLMGAMLDCRTVRIEYRKYTGEGAEILHVEPYAVKEAAQRWYLVGRCLDRNALRVYGLDRIVRLETCRETFRMPEGFDVDELFAESYGVYLAGKDEVRTISFRCDSTQAKYLRDLPLHPSQVEVSTGKDGSVTFAMRAGINEALTMEFARLGSKVEVLAPETLRRTL